MIFFSNRGISRRKLLQGMAAAAGGVGLSGCDGEGGLLAGAGSGSPTSPETASVLAPSSLSPAPTSSPPPSPPSSLRPFRNARTNTRYALLRDAVAAAASGDTIKVTGGNYSINSINDVGALWIQYGIHQSDLTIEWETVGVLAVFDISPWVAANNAQGGDGSGIVMGATCTNLTLRGMGIRGFRNGNYHGNAGVYAMPGYPLPEDRNGPVSTLTMEYCWFSEHTNGIITNSNHNLSVYLRYSMIQDCSASGLSHGCYVGGASLFDVFGCTFKSTPAAFPQQEVGHFLKSRAKTTTVRASKFDGAYGCARLMDISNGGAFTCTGNILLHYGAARFADDNMAIGYGAEQTPFFRQGSPQFGNNTDNWVGDGRTHSVLFAQNTVRKAQPEGGTPFDYLHVYAITNDNDQQVTVSKTVRNSIVAGPYAATFVSTYPLNLAVPLLSVGNDGIVPSAPAGTANDAVYEYVDELRPPSQRKDLVMGARAALPGWVPTVAWQFTDIPGTRFDDYMKNDGTGIAPIQTEELPGHGSPQYAQQYAFGGGAYSPKNHELYLFGGGHNATSINALSRWNLGKNSPDMTLVSAPTSFPTRLAEYGVGNYYTSGYWSDGRPRSPHSYRNAQYIDSIDEFVCVTLSEGDSPNLDAYHWNVIPGFPRGGSAWRADGYWPSIPSDPGGALGTSMLCFPSYDQSIVYYSVGGGPLRKLDTTTRAISAVGTVPVNWTTNARAAARHDASVALIVGGNESSTGWRARLIDLGSGLQTQTVVSGTAWPSNHEYQDLVWVPLLGKWVALLYNSEYGDTNIVASAKIIALTPTGNGSLDATVLPITGVPPSGTGGALRGLYWDVTYGVLIVGVGPAELLKAIRVG